MIKPSEISPHISELSAENLADIEEQFDAAIKAARNAHQWPARVGIVRDTATVAEIEHMANRYRHEGWEVVTGQQGARALIDHPDRKR
jgi:polysaccharide deacetylase 2 family uncharacterized protein YibQ